MAGPKLEMTEAIMITAESILTKISQDHLKCSICLETFTDPTFLDCHHTFCRSCLDNMVTSDYGNHDHINCPTCRHKTSLQGKRTSGLQLNFVLASLADDVTSQKKLLRVQQGAPTCSLCDDDSRVVIQCIECDESLCQDCWFHQEHIHADHTVDVLNHREKVPRCDQHPDLEISFYCQTCRVLICAMCAAMEHRGKDHEYTCLEDAETSSRQQLLELLSKCEERHREAIVERSLILGERHMTEAMIFNATKSIRRGESADQERVVSQLQEFERARVADYLDALTSADATIEWVKQICDMVNNQVTEASQFKLLQQMDHLVTSMEAVIKTTLPIVTSPKLLSIKVSLSDSDSDADVVITKKDRYTNELEHDISGLFYEIRVQGYM